MATIASYTCIICGQHNLKEVQMKQHLQIEHADGFTCPMCDVNCHSEDVLLRHINQVHKNLFTPPKNSRKSGKDESHDLIDLCSPIKTHSDLLDEIVTYTPDNSVIRTIDFTTKVKLKVNKETQTCDSIVYDPPPLVPLTCDEYKCPLCDYVTGTAFDMQCHIEHGHYESETKLNDHFETETKLNGHYETETNVDCPAGLDEYHCNFVHIPDEDNMVHNTATNRSTLTDIRGVFVDIANNEPNLSLCEPTTHVMPVSGGASNINNYNQKSTNHLRSNSSHLYDCPFCGNSYDSLSSVEVHIERLHPSVESTVESTVDSTSKCPMCDVTCDVTMMTDHVNSHFDSSTPQHNHNTSTRDTQPTSYKYQGEYYHQKSLLHRENVYGVDDGNTCTSGIMSRVAHFYLTPPANVISVHLCSHVDHYAGSIGDKGWGCGYRNLQMLLSSLAVDDVYRDILFNGRAMIPSIPKIQRLIETAWQKGFDKQGSKQLNGRLVNTNKWIGATDIMATLQSLNVKCKLMDFHYPSSSDGTHPKLFQWVTSYFIHHSRPAFLPPLLLQHQGHSRTIVGIERLSDGSSRILLFDPGTSKSQMEKLKRKVNSDTLKFVRRGLVALKSKQYQVLAVIGVIDSSEYDQYKTLKSERC